MLEKKFPEVDLGKQRKFIFLISLIVVLTLVNVAFEWRSYEDFEQIDLVNVLGYEVIDPTTPPLSPPQPRVQSPLPPQDTSAIEEIILSVSFAEDYDK